jgi:hypothetical protein
MTPQKQTLLVDGEPGKYKAALTNILPTLLHFDTFRWVLLQAA